MLKRSEAHWLMRLTSLLLIAALCQPATASFLQRSFVHPSDELNCQQAIDSGGWAVSRHILDLFDVVSSRQLCRRVFAPEHDLLGDVSIIQRTLPISRLIERLDVEAGTEEVTGRVSCPLKRNTASAGISIYPLPPNFDPQAFLSSQETEKLAEVHGNRTHFRR
jgi:hypothetical protein